MEVRYFEGIDTLYIEFRVADIAETRDLDENTTPDLDGSGRLCAITVEHARDRAEIFNFSFEHVAS
jgi:uncharacterized protein YuzE